MGGVAPGGGQRGEGGGLRQGRSGGAQPSLRLLPGGAQAAVARPRARREDVRLSSMIVRFEDQDSLYDGFTFWNQRAVNKGD